MSWKPTAKLVGVRRRAAFSAQAIFFVGEIENN
jgi:hypothetical protein